MRLVSLVGSRHDDHHCDPNGGSGGGDDDGDGAIALATGPSAGSGLVCDANESVQADDVSGLDAHTRRSAGNCVWTILRALSICSRHSWGAGGRRRAKARDENCAVWEGEMGLPAAKTQGHRGRRRTGETGRIQTPERKGSREEDGDESGRGEGGKDVCEKKGGWGKRAKSADDVLPSESAKFTALGSDAQRRSWGVREQRMAPRFAGSGRHKLWRSIQGWRALVAQHGCNALYQGADWLQRHCTPRQGRN